jgi:hypothetical protein
LVASVRAGPSEVIAVGTAAQRTLAHGGVITVPGCNYGSTSLAVSKAALKVERISPFCVQRSALNAIRSAKPPGSDIREPPTHLLDQRLAVGLDIECRAGDSPNDDRRFTPLISV